MQVSKKVIPGLSLKSSDLRSRLKTATFKLPTEGLSYSEDKSVVDTLNMSHTDVARAYVKDAVKTRDLEAQIAKDRAKAAKAADDARIEKIKAEAKAEALREAKGGNNG